MATQQQAVSAAQTQVNKDQAATDLATAQTAATNAQNIVDETNSQVDALKAKENTESAGITLSQSYIDAYNSQGTYNSQDENYNPDLLVQVENEIKNFPNTATIIEYQPTAADEEAKVTDAGQLTFDQSKELTTFAASIINGIRKQIGVAPIKVTDGAVKIIMLRAAQEVKEGNDAGKSNALYEQNFNKAWNDADLTSAGIKSNLVSDAEIANEVGKYNYEINGRDTLPMRLDSTTSWINNGIESSYTMASLKQKVYEAIQSMLANPNQYYEEPNSLLTGKDDELLDQYLGVVFDAYGNLHMYFIDNYKATDNSGNEYEIPTDSIFFNGETTPAPLSATGGLTTADQAKLKDLQATLTTQQATLKSAKAALATAQAAATKLGVTAAVDATILQADQAKLATAKAALATAQKTATTAQAALNSAKANLTKAQQKALIADQALTAAKTAQQKAEQHLANLQNADANLAAANAAVAQAQTDLVAAQAAYDKTVAPAKAAATALAAAKAVLANAQTKLAAAQADLAKRQAADTTQKTVVLQPATSSASAQQTAANVQGSGSSVRQLAVDKTASSKVTSQPVILKKQAQNSATKAARSQQFVGQALPQANGVKQSYLTVIGLLLLSALGLGAYGKKRRV